MDTHLSHELKQGLSPRIIQTQKLLQLNQQDLVEMLKEEAETNPMIKLDYKKPKKKNSLKKTASGSFDKQAFIENLSVYGNNTQNYLFEQISYLNLNETEEITAKMIISSLDEKGFIPPDFYGRNFSDDRIMTKDFTLPSISRDTFESIRKMILQFEPFGIASYGYAEYLKLQAEKLYGTDSIEYRIFNSDLKLLEQKKYSMLARKLKTTFESIEKAVENIRTFQLSPLDNTAESYAAPVIPDAQIKDGQLVLFDEYIPNIKLNKYYMEIYQNSDNKNTKQYIKNNLHKANDLIDNLQSRKEILFRIITMIIEKQSSFFTEGNKMLAPLQMKDIAEELNYAESTVSRSIKDKYIQTDFGILPLKFFFSGDIRGKKKSADGISAQSVKLQIREIIGLEDKDDPLSDDKIVRILKNKNITISRRTVAKYRSELGILPKSQRKKPH